MNGRLNIPLFVFIFFALFSTGCSDYEISYDYVKPTDGSSISNTAAYTEDSHEISDDELAHEEDSPSADSGIPEEDLSGDLEPEIPVEDVAEPPADLPTSEDLPTDEAAQPDGTSPLPNDEPVDETQIPEEPSQDYGSCVNKIGVGEVTLYWEQPLQNVDGSPLLNLAGYRVFYGERSGNLANIIDVGPNTNPTIYNLDSGIWYFRVKVYNTAGIESNFSNETCAAL